jgi:hypothetical protein
MTIPVEGIHNKKGSIIETKNLQKITFLAKNIKK